MQLGYFQVMAEPVSTCVQEILEFLPAAIATLRHEVVDTALAFLVAGIPVLNRRVFDLGIIECDQFDDSGMELVFIPPSAQCNLPGNLHRSPCQR